MTRDLGYYTQGGDNMERNYNQYVQGKYSLNSKNNPAFNYMPDIQQITDSELRPSIDQKIPPLPDNYEKIPSKDQMPAKKYNMEMSFLKNIIGIDGRL